MKSSDAALTPITSPFEAIAREVKWKWNPVVHFRNHDDEVEKDGDAVE